jgi:hypothetical protein
MLKMRGFAVLAPRDKGFFGYLYVKVLAHQRVDDVMFSAGVMNQASCVMSVADVASVRADMARQRLDTGDFWEESASSPAHTRNDGAEARAREIHKIILGGFENTSPAGIGKTPVCKGLKKVFGWIVGIPLALALSVMVLFFKAFMFCYCLPHECAHFIIGLLVRVLSGDTDI